MTLHYTATAEDSGKKLFSILRYRLHLSAGLIKRLKHQTLMYVNGTPVYTNYIIAPGDRDHPTATEGTRGFPPEPGPLNILYEDEAIIALHKPAGIIIHPSATRNTGTLANRLLAYLGGGTVHPVNRLDRDTTGCDDFCKKRLCKEHLDGIHGKSPDSQDLYRSYLRRAAGEKRRDRSAH